jgi:hypothetical protein
VGLQIVAGRFQDTQLLQAAAAGLKRSGVMANMPASTFLLVAWPTPDGWLRWMQLP